MTKTHATRKPRSAGWSRSTLVTHYEEVAIPALSGALLCQRSSNPGSDSGRGPGWMGNPNMSGILAEIAES